MAVAFARALGRGGWRRGRRFLSMRSCPKRRCAMGAECSVSIAVSFCAGSVAMGETLWIVHFRHLQISFG